MTNRRQFVCHDGARTSKLAQSADDTVYSVPVLAIVAEDVIMLLGWHSCRCATGADLAPLSTAGFLLCGSRLRRSHSPSIFSIDILNLMAYDVASFRLRNSAMSLQ